jgi:formylglycine-generating enzyme
MKNTRRFLFIFFLFLIMPPSVFGQKCSDYDCVIRKVKKAMVDKNYRLAFEQLESAEGYPSKNPIQIAEFRKQLFNAIEKEKDEAKRLKIIAEEATLKAKEEQLKTQKALDEAQAANIRVIAAYIKDIERHILKLEYEAAAEKCQAALALNIENQKTIIAPYVFEVAYWFTESDTVAAAVNILKSLNINSLSNRSALRKAIEENAPPQYFTTLEEKYYPKLNAIEGGSFDLDSAYTVTVNAFKLAQTETTVWQYFLFQRATKYSKPITPAFQWSGNHPIVNVSWYDAAFYLNWLSERKGFEPVYILNKLDDDDFNVIINYAANGFRLPTEAEWAFSGRGGIYHAPFTYSGSDDVDKVAWHSGNSDNQTHPVGHLKPNALGLYDMTGNVWEWCNDWYKKGYDKSKTTNPIGEKEGIKRLRRGGSWIGDKLNNRLVSRFNNAPKDRYDSIGFRVLKEK